MTQGQVGTVAIGPHGTLTYKLTRFIVGTDTFSYTVSDGRGRTATGNITVNVQLPPLDGIMMIRSQVTALNPSQTEAAVLRAELRVAQYLLDHGQPRAAAVTLRVFVLSVRISRGLGQMNAATADLLIGEAQTVNKLLS